MGEKNCDNHEPSEFYKVAIAHGSIVTTIKIHKFTVTPQETLLQNEDEFVLTLLKDEKNRLSPLTRNHEGKTLISLAVEGKRKMIHL